MDENELNGLAEAFRKGDRRSFKKMVESLTRPLIAMAYRYTLDWESARDLTQETWIKVYERVGGYNPDRSFRVWLCAVHRNTCLSHLRRPFVRREQAMSHDEVEKLQAAAPAGDPHSELERREFRDRLLEAVGKLSESQRQVFARVDLERMERAEVAEALGIKPATLRTTLHFARKRLAGMLRRMEESS